MTAATRGEQILFSSPLGSPCLAVFCVFAAHGPSWILSAVSYNSALKENQAEAKRLNYSCILPTIPYQVTVSTVCGRGLPTIEESHGASNSGYMHQSCTVTPSQWLPDMYGSAVSTWASHAWTVSGSFAEAQQLLH